MFHSRKIIDRLYEFYRVGDLHSYKVNALRFDQYIFRANNYVNNFERFIKSFDKDGAKLDYVISENFTEDPEPIKE